MHSENQYLDLYQSSSRIIKKNSAEVLNAVRDAAFEDFRRLGFPSRKIERYKSKYCFSECIAILPIISHLLLP